ncbi:hypothetical protein [Microbacterium sp. p3-SID131]|uniref:hypothetical protein n=1 Tax=Microbacterium sp. p3-SID131 TaxID=2916215 RepID=UPI0021A3CF92|nr:hypothetical protein [Microbacterium sp. p3-SID131]MCT1363946.1 hypothetical protein [Microbacterium sp. p3-SID131]
MTDQKLIDDVVTAFADRDITAPSRDDIARVLEVFETSLRRCGCDDCTTARRERIGLTELDCGIDIETTQPLTDEERAHIERSILSGSWRRRGRDG